LVVDGADADTLTGGAATVNGSAPVVNPALDTLTSRVCTVVKVALDSTVVSVEAFTNIVGTGLPLIRIVEFWINDVPVTVSRRLGLPSGAADGEMPVNAGGVTVIVRVTMTVT
jgi:hypothetical protein